MEKIIMRIIRPATYLFNRIIDKEAKRVDDFNRQMFEYRNDEGGENKMQTMSSVRRDFVASHLRSQLGKLRGILDSIEEEEVDSVYTYESLKEIEIGLRAIRKVCLGNN